MIRVNPWTIAWSTRSTASCADRAKATAQSAIELDESLAEAHVTLAIVNSLFDVDREIAEREFKRAITLDSNYGLAHQWYGAHLCFMADFEHGLAELRQAQRLEPLSPMINVQLGVGLYLARRYEDASRVLQNIVAFETAFWPAHFFLGLVFAQQREDGRAFAEMDRAAELSGRHPLTLSGLGHLLGRTGEREKAVEILKELRGREQTEYISPDHFALIHLALGDEKLALDWLQKTVEERSAYSLWLAVEPRLDPLRDNNSFRAVLRNVFTRADATGGG